MISRKVLVLALLAFVSLFSTCAVAVADSHAEEELVFRFDFTSDLPTPEKNPRNWEWFFWADGSRVEKPQVRDGIAEFSIGGAYTMPVEFDCDAFVCEFEIAEVRHTGSAIVLGFGEGNKKTRFVNKHGFYLRVMANAVTLLDQMTREIVVCAEKDIDLSGSNFKKVRVENFPGGSRILIDGKVVAESGQSVTGTARSRFGVGQGWGLPSRKQDRRIYGRLNAKLKSIALYQSASEGSGVRAVSAFGSPVSGGSRAVSAFGSPVSGGSRSGTTRAVAGTAGASAKAPNSKPKSSSSAGTAVVPADSGDKLSDARENLPGENYDAPWPKLTRVPAEIPVRAVKDGPGEWIYETPHFQFISNAPVASSAITGIAPIFEGTYQANLALPLSSPVCNFWQVSEKGRFKVRLYEYEDQYKDAGGLSGGFRGWITSTVTKTAKGIGPNKLIDGAVLVPFSTLGFKRRADRYDCAGTPRANAEKIVLEITYMLATPGSGYPAWFSEGLLNYIKLSYDGGGCVRFAGNKPKIVKALQLRPGQRTRVDATFREILCGTKWNSKMSHYIDVSLLLFYYFVHLDRKGDAALVKKYVKALREGVSQKDAANILLDGRFWEDLEKEFCRKIKSEMNADLVFEQSK